MGKKSVSPKLGTNEQEQRDFYNLKFDEYKRTAREILKIQFILKHTFVRLAEVYDF